MSAEIIHGDCLDVMRGMPDASVDAIVTDPPYGINDSPLAGTNGRQTNTWHPPTTWDATINPAWCREAARVAPVVVWFGHWRKRFEVEAAMPMPIRCEIVWRKDRHVGFPCPLAMQDERVWVFAAKGIKAREFATTVWDHAGIPSWSYKHHKNEKPVGLMARLIRVFTDPSALILDPFAGSGSTGVAAAQEGRRFIGIECDPDHAETARRRIADAQAQTTLGVA
jgi:adenine-specific DNA-methyltransferase